METFVWVVESAHSLSYPIYALPPHPIPATQIQLPNQYTYPTTHTRADPYQAPSATSISIYHPQPAYAPSSLDPYLVPTSTPTYGWSSSYATAAPAPAPAPAVDPFPIHLQETLSPIKPPANPSPEEALAASGVGLASWLAESVWGMLVMAYEPTRGNVVPGQSRRSSEGLMTPPNAFGGGIGRFDGVDGTRKMLVPAQVMKAPRSERVLTSLMTPQRVNDGFGGYDTPRRISSFEDLNGSGAGIDEFGFKQDLYNLYLNSGLYPPPQATPQHLYPSTIHISPPLSPVASLQPNPYGLRTKVTSSFINFTYRTLSQTLLSPTAVVLSLWYIRRMAVHCGGEDEGRVLRMKLREAVEAKDGLGGEEAARRVLVLGLACANKWLDDNTFTNKSWSDVTALPLIELNRLEILALSPRDINFDLSVSVTEWQAWVEEVEQLVSSPFVTDARLVREIIHAQLYPALDSARRRYNEEVEQPRDLIIERERELEREKERERERRSQRGRRERQRGYPSYAESGFLEHRPQMFDERANWSVARNVNALLLGSTTPNSRTNSLSRQALIGSSIMASPKRTLPPFQPVPPHHQDIQYMNSGTPINGYATPGYPSYVSNYNHQDFVNASHPLSDSRSRSGSRDPWARQWSGLSHADLDVHPFALPQMRTMAVGA